MTADDRRCLLRAKTLALAAMISAGGKPCWVAAAADSPRPRPDRADKPPPPAAPAVAAPLSQREIELMANLPPFLRDSMMKAFATMDRFAGVPGQARTELAARSKLPAPAGITGRNKIGTAAASASAVRPRGVGQNW